jgi:hypothetical protein
MRSPMPFLRSFQYINYTAIDWLIDWWVVYLEGINRSAIDTYLGVCLEGLRETKINVRIASDLVGTRREHLPNTGLQSYHMTSPFCAEILKLRQAVHVYTTIININIQLLVNHNFFFQYWWPWGSTQPLTEMSTRNLPGGKKRSARKADNLSAICEPNVWKCGSLGGMYRDNFTLL